MRCARELRAQATILRHNALVIGQVFTQAVIGALDGGAAALDAKAGRSWDSPGLEAGGMPVLSWGYSPVLQSTSLLVGVALAAAGYGRYGQPLVEGGVNLMARAGAFKLGSRGQASVPPTQG